MTLQLARTAQTRTADPLPLRELAVLALLALIAVVTALTYPDLMAGMAMAF